MRTFLYSMPSSGGTFVAWTLCKTARTLGLLDMCVGPVPEPSWFPAGMDVIAKDTVGSTRHYKQWIDTFQPDRVVIVRRNPNDVRASMTRRYTESKVPGRFLPDGTESIDRLFGRLRRAVRYGCHDDVLEYEEVVATSSPSRSLMDIAIQNHLHCEWCRPNYYPQRWSFGGIRTSGGGLADERLIWHVVRYYGKALGGARRVRRMFARNGFYLPPRHWRS